MLFNSLKFAAFFPTVAAIFFVLPFRLRVFWLLAASYLFYMAWNPKYALLMLGSTAVTWLAGIAMDEVARRFPAHRAAVLKKWIMVACLTANLLVLFVFKYANFLLSGLETLVHHFGLDYSLPTFSILLPVGISFYIFQAIGYTVDVYRGDIPSERNFFYYALFVSFFPQLVAGPIERSRHILPQLHQKQTFDWERTRSGLIQMLWGYLQKMVIADRLAIFVDGVYANSQNLGAAAHLFALIFFAMQLYCDFSSYSDIAIGCARIMGFDLMRNFDSPYLSSSLSAFWDRWHISLSKWFQDYLYIPLGGSRKGTWRTCRNLFLVFLLSGLWHGAAMTFVIWGALHGIYTVISRLTQQPRARLRKAAGLDKSRVWRFLCTVWVFAFVCLTLAFFRAENLAQALDILRGLGRWQIPFTLEGIGMDRPDFVLSWILIAVLLICDILRRKYGPLTPRLISLPLVLRWVILLAGILAWAVFGLYGEGYVEQPFIYFQF